MPHSYNNLKMTYLMLINVLPYTINLIADITLNLIDLIRVEHFTKFKEHQQKTFVMLSRFWPKNYI